MEKIPKPEGNLSLCAGCGDSFSEYQMMYIEELDKYFCSMACVGYYIGHIDMKNKIFKRIDEEVKNINVESEFYDLEMSIYERLISKVKKY
jgi:hypothetical protein